MAFVVLWFAAFGLGIEVGAKLHVIADHICPKGTPIPGKDKWPGKRFDVVWRCAPDPATGVYAFDQIPQMLLAGDSSDPIAT